MKILVVDDHALVREGLSQVLQGLCPDECTEVLQAAHAAQAFDLARAHADLDLVLLDYHLPDVDGLSALTILGQRHPELPVVILSGSANPGVMQHALERGAAGFVTKAGQSEDLLASLRRVLAGEVVFPDELGGPLGPGAGAAGQRVPVFTTRQEEVLQLLLDGLSNREIGDALHVTEETIKSHVAVILRTLGVKTRLQAAVVASRWGYSKSGSLPG